MSPLPKIRLQRRDMRINPCSIAFACAMLVAPAWGAEDPGARVLQQHQLQRQQQQEALQLRMQQQQLSLQTTPADVGQRQALEQLQLGQRQRLDQQHYRQAIEPSTAQPSDDEATRRAKAERERQKVRQ